MITDVLIIYASASGNVEAVCKKVADVLSTKGFRPNLKRAELSSITDIQSGKYIILATSTWEHGAINPYFLPLLKEMKSNHLTGKFASFIGLGDTRYEPVYFCEGMNELQRVFEARGGRTIGVPLKINGDPYDLLDSMVTDWTNKLCTELIDFDFNQAEANSKSILEEVTKVEHQQPKDQISL